MTVLAAFSGAALAGQDGVEGLGGADQPLRDPSGAAGDQAGIGAHARALVPVEVGQAGGLLHVARGVLRPAGLEGAGLLGDQRRSAAR